MNLESVKLGVTAASLSDDVRQAPRLARVSGFGGIQFDAVSRGLDLTQLSASGRREFLLLLRSQEQQLVGLRQEVGARGFSPGADVDRELARLKGVLESAAALAAPLACVDLGPLPEPQREVAPRPALTEKQAGLILLPTPQPAPKREQTPPPDPIFVAQVDAALSELGKMADRFSVIVALRSSLATFWALERAVRAADCPWFGIDFDPAGALHDEWTLDEIFSRLGPLIRHVRASDAVKGSNASIRPVMIGQGNVQWENVLANLDAAAYRGWLTIDSTDQTNRFAAAQHGLKYLKKM